MKAIFKALFEAIFRAAGATALMLAACASVPDHLYVLADRPPAAAMATPTGAPTGTIRLRTTLAPLVDRNELVLNGPAQGDAVLMLQHERWATNLGDQVSRTLARDLERRRPDLLVADGAFERAAAKPILMTVSVVTLSARLGGRATLAAHWRIEDPAAGKDVLGSDQFDIDLDGADYAAVAQAFSALVGELADRLTASLGTP